MKDGIGHLIQLIDNIVVKHHAWGIIEQTRGGIGPWLQFVAGFFVTAFNFILTAYKSGLGNWNQWNSKPCYHRLLHTK